MKTWWCDSCHTVNSELTCSGCNRQPVLLRGGIGFMDEKVKDLQSGKDMLLFTLFLVLMISSIGFFFLYLME